MAPDCRATSRPFRNAISVGMLRMPKRVAMAGSASVSSFATRACEASSAAACSIGRRHHPARPTPRRPEVHDHRQIVALDMAVEIRGRELDRMGRQQRLLAAAAMRARAEALAQHAVDRVAGRAHDAQILGHEHASPNGGRSAPVKVLRQRCISGTWGQTAPVKGRDSAPLSGRWAALSGRWATMLGAPADVAGKKWGQRRRLADCSPIADRWKSGL